MQFLPNIETMTLCAFHRNVCIIFLAIYILRKENLSDSLLKNNKNTHPHGKTKQLIHSISFELCHLEFSIIMLGSYVNILDIRHDSNYTLFENRLVTWERLH